MSICSTCISDRNSVGSSACRSMRLKGTPSSSFQKGSANVRLSAIGPSSLPRAAVSSSALARKRPTKWKRLRWLFWFV